MSYSEIKTNKQTNKQTNKTKQNSKPFKVSLEIGHAVHLFENYFSLLCTLALLEPGHRHGCPNDYFNNKVR